MLRVALGFAYGSYLAEADASERRGLNCLLRSSETGWTRFMRCIVARLDS